MRPPPLPPEHHGGVEGGGQIGAQQPTTQHRSVTSSNPAVVESPAVAGTGKTQSLVVATDGVRLRKGRDEQRQQEARDGAGGKAYGEYMILPVPQEDPTQRSKHIHDGNDGTLLFFLHVMFPLATLSAAIMRVSIPSFVYFVAVLVYFIAPQAVLPMTPVIEKGRTRYRCRYPFFWRALLVLPVLVFVAHLIYLIMSWVRTSGAPGDPFLWRLCGGFRAYTGLTDALRHLLPEVFVFATSLKLYRMMSVRGVTPSPSVDWGINHQEQATASRPTPLSVRLFFLALLASGCALPSLMGAIYYFSFVFALTLWSIGLGSSRRGRLLVYVTMVISAFHLVVAYVFQFHDSIVRECGYTCAVLGFEYLRAITLRFSPHYMSLVAVGILYLLCTICTCGGSHAMLVTVAKRGSGGFGSEEAPPTADGEDDRTRLRNLGSKLRKGRLFKRSFQRKVLTKLALAGMICWSLLLRSVPSFFLLVAFICGVFVEPSKFARYSPILVLYTALLLFTLYASNMATGFDSDGTIYNEMGFHQFQQPAPTLFGTSVVFSILVFYTKAHWPSQRVPTSDDGKDKSVSDSEDDDETVGEKDVSGEVESTNAAHKDAKNEVREAPTRRSVDADGKPVKANGDMVAAGATWFTTAVDIMWQFLISHAYKISMLVLYVFGMSEVNLLHSGYLLFFIVFVISPRIAERWWVVLVFYCDLVIMSLYLWQFSFASGSVNNNWTNGIGVVRFSKPVFGLFWHICVLIFAICQLRVYQETRKSRNDVATGHCHPVLIRLRVESTMFSFDGSFFVLQLAKTLDIPEFCVQVEGLEEASAGDGEDDTETPNVQTADSAAGVESLPESEKSFVNPSEVWVTVRIADAPAVTSLSSLRRLDAALGSASLALLRVRELVVLYAPEPSWFDLIASFSKNLFWRYGTFVCYVSYVVIAVIPSPNIISLTYIILFFVALCLHQRSGHPFSAALRSCWYVIVNFSGVTVIAQYLYQFTVVAEFFEGAKIFGISPSEVGLQLHNESLFWNLTGYTTVFILSVCQLRVMKAHETRKEAGFTGGDADVLVEYPPVLQAIASLVLRFFILHTSKLVLVLLFIEAVKSKSAIGLCLVGYVVLALPFFRYLRSTFPLMVFMQGLTLVTYIFQFSWFSAYHVSDWVEWLGLLKKSTIWGAVGGYIVVVCAAFYNQLCMWYEDDVKQKLGSKRVSLFRYSSSTDLLGSSGDSSTTGTDSGTQAARTGTHPALDRVAAAEGVVLARGANKRSSISSTASHGMPLLEESDDEEGAEASPFKAHMKFFISYFFWLFGLEVCLMTLLIASFLRLNVYSAVYMCAVAFGCQRLKRHTVLKYLEFLIIFSSIVILSQYTLLLGPPPIDSVGQFPWKEMDVQYQVYFGFGHFEVWLVSAEFAILFSAVLYRHVIKLEETDPFEVPDFSKGNTRSLYSRTKYYFYRSLMYNVLVLVLINGTMQYDALSFGYVVFSLYFLYNDWLLLDKGNDLWRLLRIYNYVILLCETIYQAPFWDWDNYDELNRYNVGLYRLNSLSSLRIVDGVLLDVLIFMLALIQARVFESKEYKLILQRISRETKYAQERAYMCAQKDTQNVLSEFAKIEKYRSQRWQRLEMLKRGQTVPVNIASAAYVMDIEEEDPPENQSESQQQKLHKEDKEVEPSEDLEKGTIVVIKTPNTSEVEVASGEDENKDKDKGGEEKPSAFLSIVDWWIVFLERLDRTPKLEVGSPNKAEVATRGPKRGRLFRLLAAIFNMLGSHTESLCYVLFCLNNMMYLNWLSVVYPIVLFGYALFENPRPPKAFWLFILAYTMIVLCAKYLFQFNVFCMSPEDTYSVIPNCADRVTLQIQKDSTRLGQGAADLALDHMVGLHKFSKPYFAAVIWDILVLIALLLHRHVLQARGYWGLATIHTERALGAKSSVTSPEVSSPCLKTVPFASEGKTNAPDGTEEDAKSTASDGEAAGRNHWAQRNSIHAPVVVADIGEMEDRDKLVNSTKNRNGFQLIQAYFNNLVSGTLKPGRDFHAYLFAGECFCFFYLVIFFPLVVGRSDQKNVIETVEKEGQVSSEYVFALLLQFALILIDRIIYLYRSLRAKLVLQYITVFVFHIVIFFVVPHQSVRAFSTNPWLQIIYVLKVFYFYYSALEIHYGYPQFTQGQFLTRTPSAMRYYAILVYRAIPYLFELRTLLDWICIDTTLIFYEWLKLEDIYYNLFQAKCDRVAEINEGRALGQKQKALKKFCTGTTIFIILVTIVWFPLLFFSAANPWTEKNEVSRASVSLTLDHSIVTYEMSHLEHLRSMTKSAAERMKVKYAEKVNPSVFDKYASVMQLVLMDQDSEHLWSITPPNRKSFAQALADYEHDVVATLSFSFTRIGPPDNKVIQGSTETVLTKGIRENLLSLLNGNDTVITLPALFPRFIRLPPGGSPIPLKQSPMVDCILMLNKSSAGEWWTLVEKESFGDPYLPSSGIEFIVLSDKIAMANSWLQSTGMLGLYITVVLSIGRFLRVYVSNLGSRVVFEDMPNPDPLIQHCLDIYMARQEKDLKLEEELYRQLIEIYRSPQTILQITDVPLQTMDGKRKEE